MCAAIWSPQRREIMGNRFGIKGQETSQHSRDPDAAPLCYVPRWSQPTRRCSDNAQTDLQCRRRRRIAGRGSVSPLLLKPLPLRSPTARGRPSGLQMPFTWTPGGVSGLLEEGAQELDSYQLPRSNCETICSSNAWRSGEQKLFDSRTAQA